MVEEKQLEPEVIQIKKCIEEGKNFLLSGGAGSGKTYSLVQTIQAVISINPSSSIACITYTNAAAQEIERRIIHPNLKVSTIHDFLWDNIKSFQKELKKCLLELLSDESSNIKITDEEIPDNLFNNLEEGIQYKEWTRVKEGIISHDEVIELANKIYQNYPILCGILKDKFSFIFVDEYQDTHPNVIEILLESLKKSSKKNIIGFFGDAMQSIYDDTIGDLKEYIDKREVIEIKKEQNRRNPKKIIDLANLLRTDGIKQEPSQDLNAPNVENGVIKEGVVKFIHSDIDNLEQIKLKHDLFSSWDFSNSEQTKELNLTHNLIAPKAGYPTLMETYSKDRILEFKDKLIKKIKSDNIEIDEDLTFGQVIEQVNISPTGVVLQFIEDNKELFEEAKKYPFSVFKKIYVSNDNLIDDKKQNPDEESKKGSKRDGLIQHLFKISDLIFLYQNNRVNEVFKKSDFRIKYVGDKKALKSIIDEIQGMSESTIEEVINYANEKGICKIGDKLTQFIEQKEYVYNRVKKVKFREFQNLYNYLEGYTPFSTQHKTKGAEFDNVLVVLDNGGWNKYNFKYLLEEAGTASVKDRSHKLFYVCCTRAKEQLIIFYFQPSQRVLSTAKKWFGEDNVINVSSVA